MLTEPEAQQLMLDLIRMRDEINSSKNPDVNLLSAYKKHQNMCAEKFKYLVSMRTGRYKSFSNYDDLNQDGFEALNKAMLSYKPNKGSFFWWAHKYIDTNIARRANLHTTIRYPLKVAKKVVPHKESSLPLLIEDRYCPDKQLESAQTFNMVDMALVKLNSEQKDAINLSFGLQGDKPLSLNKICKKLNLSRSVVKKNLKTAMILLKESIKV